MCKKLNDWGFCINGHIWNPRTCDKERNKACKFDEYLDIENCSCEKRLIGKLVLVCVDEILNTTERSFGNKISVCENNSLIHTISLIVICRLLLAAVFIGCYYYYKKTAQK